MNAEHRPAVLIATLLNEHGPTGVQTHFNTFRQCMESLGVRIEVLTPFSSPKLLVYPIFALRKLIDPISGPLSVWWYRYWHEVFLKMALRKRLVMQENCVVYAQCPLSARAALRARTHDTQRIVMVVHFNSSQADEWSDKGKIAIHGAMARSIRTLEVRVLAKLDGIVYVSNYMRETMEQRVPLLKTTRNSVIPNFCLPVADSRSDINKTDIINIGTLEPRKNQQFLLRVLAAAARQGRRYTLALVGDGPDRTQLESMIKELLLHDQVKLVGYHPKAVQLISSARIYAHSATIENMPLVIIEAMACGVPVLAPRVGGIPDLIVDGEHGYFWDTTDADAAADLLIRVLDMQESLVRMGRAAKARFDSHFKADRISAQLYEFMVCTEPSQKVDLRHIDVHCSTALSPTPPATN